MEKETEIIITKVAIPLIKEFLIPKIKSLIKKNKLKEALEAELEEAFGKYLIRYYNKHYILDTIVFPNKQTHFDELYEPLTIRRELFNDQTESECIDKYPKVLIDKYYRIMIEDSAGMGKSTMMKKIFLSAVKLNEGVPFFIEIRKISKTNTILDEIHNQLSDLGKDFDMNLILDLFQEGNFIFLFDGFDEIPIANKDFVYSEIEDFLVKAIDNKFIITSRPEQSLSSFGGFVKFNVKPLEEKDAFSLFYRYDKYSYKAIADNLIRTINLKNTSSVKEFLSNPFLASLLYKSYEYKKDIPLKKCQFYSQVYDALFEAHDLSKDGYLRREKYSNLHIDDFEKVLRYIGFFTSIENQIAYDKDYLKLLIEKVKNHLPDLHFNTTDYIKDLLRTVPLFKRDGDSYKWSHKSLQDYFCAKFLWLDAKEKQESILLKIYNDISNRRFINVLDIFYELDKITFENTIQFWLLSDLEKYINDSYLCFDNIDKESIVKRQIANFIYNEFSFGVLNKKMDLLVMSMKRNTLRAQSKKRTKLESLSVGEKHVAGYDYYSVNYFNVKNNIVTILIILKEREESLFSTKIENYFDDKFIEKIELENLYKIDDSKDNILNSIELFELTTKLLSQPQMLNYKKAMGKLDALKRRKSKKIEDDFLDW